MGANVKADKAGSFDTWHSRGRPCWRLNGADMGTPTSKHVYIYFLPRLSPSYSISDSSAKQEKAKSLQELQADFETRTRKCEASSTFLLSLRNASCRTWSFCSISFHISHFLFFEASSIWSFFNLQTWIFLFISATRLNLHQGKIQESGSWGEKIGESLAQIIFHNWWIW